ncbi:hypothetical protein Tco_0404644 [Tanacetum coccineum]
MKKAFQDMMHGLGEVNPTHAYYNGSCTSKDNEDPSWEYKVQDKDELRKHLQALKLLEDFISVVFCNLIGTFVRLLHLLVASSFGNSVQCQVRSISFEFAEDLDHCFEEDFCL